MVAGYAWGQKLVQLLMQGMLPVMKTTSGPANALNEVLWRSGLQHQWVMYKGSPGLFLHCYKARKRGEQILHTHTGMGELVAPPHQREVVCEMLQGSKQGHQKFS